eukprot:5733256-Pleurochrysis_carterae.AAC.2
MNWTRSLLIWLTFSSWALRLIPRKFPLRPFVTVLAQHPYIVMRDRLVRIVSGQIGIALGVVTSRLLLANEKKKFAHSVKMQPQAAERPFALTNTRRRKSTSRPKISYVGHR